MRSDIERKRQQNISAKTKNSSGVNTGIYTDSVTRDTYGELLRLASLILEAGYLTIIDAAFLLRWQRNSLRGLAEERNVPFVMQIVSCVEDIFQSYALPTFRVGRSVTRLTNYLAFT